ncbi:ABC transporter ATP-binding protein [Desulfotomaculum sp. 1211_IL3151]|uniref:ABC transporter ATP-binding protein n=1 Tax=Desulfotomaculum sp. 1211_IL3151 TaxID=3084055 RepID=UPI002FDADA87
MKMIHISGLEKNYGRLEVLKGIDIDINCGELVGYLGPNGSGKTTTLNIISGIIKPDKGTVKILGADVLCEYEKVGSSVSVVFENHGLYPKLTAGENLEYFARLKGAPKGVLRKYVDNALSSVELLEKKNTLVSTFSKGMMRRLAIARALILDPRILILDEPFDGIDISSRYSLIQLLKNWIQKPEKCILLTSHSMADIEALCNKLVIIHQGRILTSDTISSLQEKWNKNKYEVIVKDHSGPSRIQTILSKYSRIIDLDKKNGLFIIETSENPAFISSYLKEEGIQHIEIKEKHTSLEEIYLELVGKK